MQRSERAHEVELTVPIFERLRISVHDLVWRQAFRLRRRAQLG